MDPRVHKGLDGVIHHGLVINGEQVFVGDTRQGIQPAARTACEDYTFHFRSISS